VSYLLDTNILSELRKGVRCTPSVAHWATSASPDAFFTSVLVIGEIRRGVERVRGRDPRQARKLEDWLEQVRTTFAGRTLAVDDRVADVRGRMGVSRTVPVIDGLLAATAKVHGLILATRNVADVIGTGVAVLDPFAMPP
jgi:predicted nucleic acid-binding protein